MNDCDFGVLFGAFKLNVIWAGSQTAVGSPLWVGVIASTLTLTGT